MRLFTRLACLATLVQASQLVVGHASTTDSASASCSNALLRTLGPGKVSFPNDKAYQDEQKYWSAQQAEVSPLCRIAPLATTDVSTAIRVFESTQCTFSTKSGGHAPYRGASNIQDGVTIDLRNLSMISVSSDRATTSIGTGNRWIDVYNVVEPMGLDVVGGRIARIGIGGLTLGGGISFFSGRYGWAVDTTRNYELVTSGGRVLQVNQSSYPDLYFALRGGGNNFGVVTRIDMETFAQGLMWGGTRIYNVSAGPAIADAYADFAVRAADDPDAAMYAAIGYVQAEDAYIFNDFYTYARPTPNPPIFANFTKISSVSDTTRITQQRNLTEEIDKLNPDGFRETYWTATFKNSAALFRNITDIFVQESAAVKDAAGIIPAVSQQPIDKSVIAHFAKNGGNALGITPDDGPLNLINVVVRWNDAADDARIMRMASNITERSNVAARAMGLEFRYIYQNYGAAGQDVFAGYGSANKQKLLAVSRKYDPARTFQRLVPGYFKLGL